VKPEEIACRRAGCIHVNIGGINHAGSHQDCKGEQAKPHEFIDIHDLENKH
jgi:hypothetical protein